MRLLVPVAFFCGLSAAYAQPQSDEVDLELVLAVDISYSMDADELRLQRDGYIAAITSRQVLDAIREGVYGRIAVAYVEWAGSSQQSTIVDWQIVDGPETAQAAQPCLPHLDLGSAHLFGQADRHEPL
jgi:hypothetical protein